jgi:hypothetical protein
MKKPVRAIDMRRTATVLDFAVAVVSRLSYTLRLQTPYLSSPSCDLEWTMRLQAPDSGDGIVNVRLRRCGGEFPLWDVGRHPLSDRIAATSNYTLRKMLLFCWITAKTHSKNGYENQL